MDQSTDLVQNITSISQSIYTSDPHNPHLYLARGKLYSQLGFHDLAAADAYRALTLLEGVVEEEPDCVEYVARRRIATNSSTEEEEEEEEEEKDEDEDEDEGFVRISRDEYDASIAPVYVLLVQSLRQCGCLRDAQEFGSRAARHLRAFDTEDEEAGRSRYGDSIDMLENGLQQDVTTLPAQGFARRVLYPWNMHEPDRKAEETLSLLNKRLETVAPECEVRAVALPALHQQQQGEEEVSVQLGLFAKRDLQPGEIILRESSLLTATNRLHDDLCDACNGPLPELQQDEAVACQECDDTIFCSQTCHDQAQAVYHAAVCGHEGLESLGKDVADPKDKADYLYFLLLGRTIAMAVTQDCHPLDLPEVKYIWGDFHDYDPAAKASCAEDSTLPFSFQLSILQPMRLLEEMGMDPFSTLDRFDTWVLNTLYAKFRGTASGRLSTWDGGPEVCAVHPLWCLANHSCDPNVRWEWGGEITFMVRREEEKAVWKRGAEEKSPSAALIRKDEEILNHYCDIGLGVQKRREWAQGALGGLCQCARCKWESSD